MSEQNKALARKFYEEVFNKKNVAAIDQLCASNFVDHTPGPSQTESGLAGMKQFFGLFTTGFPDMKATIHQLVAEGDTVVAHITVAGTHKGPFMGAPATGKKISVHGVDILKIKNGKCAEAWHYGDEAMALAQIGLKPPA